VPWQASTCDAALLQCDGTAQLCNQLNAEQQAHRWRCLRPYVFARLSAPIRASQRRPVASMHALPGHLQDYVEPYPDRRRSLRSKMCIRSLQVGMQSMATRGGSRLNSNCMFDGDRLQEKLSSATSQRGAAGNAETPCLYRYGLDFWEASAL